MKLVPGKSSGKAAFAGRKRGFIIVGPRKRRPLPIIALSASRLKSVLTAKLDERRKSVTQSRTHSPFYLR